ncbi:ubiquitin carboxyl-terminal hydrolase 3-like [Dorcoceras hygrometricum]|uniref:Ubiquitin carboxyl-terminal hydrolase 3-like n=1 Tax=Dorcoceras hygrometricum TaxID=472368 RepID=A0A2Z7BR59_9LAMI|nr:ubiquitin carboxyl-terminal hydrolase 3-like [Dorcoceras hygrometricum]
MSGKESDNSVESVTSLWHDLVPIHLNEMVPVINLDSDDEVEILSSPPKRRNTGTEQPDGESSGIKKDPKEQQSPAKEVDTKDKDIRPTPRDPQCRIVIGDIIFY